MSDAETTTKQTPERRVGRPARIDRDLIARAACEVDQTDLTMRAVAERLGVGVTSLYYHVRDRADLAQLAAEYLAARISVPEDRGQHWSLWLAEWAEYTRQAFAAQPVVFEQFLTGSLGLERMLPHIEVVVGHMELYEFTPEEALAAYALVSACSIGAAVSELRAANVRRLLQSPDSHYRMLLEDRAAAGPFPHLARIDPAAALPTFEDQIYVTLVGIAVLRGEQIEVVVHPSAGREPYRAVEGGTTDR
jgi:AcrR family transcriptional regulator